MILVTYSVCQREGRPGHLMTLRPHRMAPTCFVCLHFLCIIYQQLKMQGVRCAFVPHVPCASRVKCGRKGDPRTQVTLTESLLGSPGCSSCGPRLLIDTLLLTFVWTVERTAGGFHDDDDSDGACTVFVGAGRFGGAWGGGGPGQEVGCRLAGGSPSAPWAQSPGRRGNGVSCGLRAAPRPGADIGVDVVLIHFVIWFRTCWRRK